MLTSFFYVNASKAPFLKEQSSLLYGFFLFNLDTGFTKRFHLSPSQISAMVVGQEKKALAGGNLMNNDSIHGEDVLSGFYEDNEATSVTDKDIAENRNTCLLSSNTSAYQNFFLLMGYAAIGMAFSADGRY